MGDDEIPIFVWSGTNVATNDLDNVGAPNRRSFGVVIGTVGAGKFIDDVDLCNALITRTYLGLRGISVVDKDSVAATGELTTANLAALKAQNWTRPGLVAATLANPLLITYQAHLATAGRRKLGFRRPRNHVSGRLAVDSRSPTSSRGRLCFVSAAQMSL